MRAQWRAPTGVFVLTAGLVVPIAALAVYIVPHTSFSLAMALFPLGVYALISLLELAIFGRNRGNPQLQRQQQQQPRRNVLQISRSIYEQLDGEILQLLLSNRDFDSNDYERLMRLEAMNARKKEGASQQQIDRLPIVSVSESMLRSPESSTCAVCLSDFELDAPVRMMRCFHHFHPNCIDTWLRSKAECPICKFPAFEGS